MVDDKVKDQYYVRTAIETLERVAEQTKGKSRAQVIKAWKQAYPFGTDRKGRKYKVWNREYNHAIKMLDQGLISFDQ